MKKKSPRYFEQPDEGEAPLSFWQVFIAVLATHLGVRSKESREQDFRRGNGLHFFVAGMIYLGLLIVGIIVLVNYLV